MGGRIFNQKGAPPPPSRSVPPSFQLHGLLVSWQKKYWTFSPPHPGEKKSTTEFVQSKQERKTLFSWKKKKVRFSSDFVKKKKLLFSGREKNRKPSINQALVLTVKMKQQSWFNEKVPPGCNEVLPVACMFSKRILLSLEYTIGLGLGTCFKLFSFSLVCQFHRMKWTSTPIFSNKSSNNFTALQFLSF